MGFKFYAFVFDLLRWMALVALALAPTVIVVVCYRKWRGQPLWSLSDVPAAAEVVLCLAWLSLLVMSHETIRGLAGASFAMGLATAAAASVFSAIPVAFAYETIAGVRRLLGLELSGHEPAAQG